MKTTTDKKTAIVLALIATFGFAATLFNATSGKPVAHACDQQPC